MPLEYDVETETGLVVVHASGEIPPEEYFGLWATFIEDDRIQNAPRILADFREIELSRSGADIRRVALGSKRFHAFMLGGSQAVVATQEASFGMARMYEALLEGTGFEIEVFRDLEEARAWILGRARSGQSDDVAD